MKLRPGVSLNHTEHGHLVIAESSGLWHVCTKDDGSAIKLSSFNLNKNASVASTVDEPVTPAKLQDMISSYLGTLNPTEVAAAARDLAKFVDTFAV